MVSFPWKNDQKRAGDLPLKLLSSSFSPLRCAVGSELARVLRLSDSISVQMKKGS